MASLIGSSPSKSKENFDAVDLLLQDHRTVDSLFAEISSITDMNNKRTRFNVLREEISKHSAVEEQLVYPVLRRLGNKDAGGKGDRLADRSLSEHQDVKEMLSRLESMDCNHSEWPSLFEKLKNDVQTHVKEEEGEILPLLRARISEENLKYMATAIEGMKKIAPTHPHPGAPSTQPGATAAGIVAGFMDRIKDMFPEQASEGKAEAAQPGGQDVTMTEASKEGVSEPINPEAEKAEESKQEEPKEESKEEKGEEKAEEKGEGEEEKEGEEEEKGKGKRGRPRKTATPRTRTQPAKKSKTEEKGEAEGSKRVTRARGAKPEAETTTA
jgi:iron-sulfur cluster repair protein YtfE (RIC family)